MMLRKRFVRASALAAILALAFATQAEGAAFVHMKDNRFAPRVHQVEVGSPVYWYNASSTGHDATSRLTDGANPFFSINLAPGADGPVVMSMPGTFNYYCTFHPRHTGAIRVVPQISAEFTNVPATAPITIASPSVPAGYGIDAQFRRAGAKKYQPYLDNETNSNVTFGVIKPGRYQLRFRTEHLASGNVSGWTRPMTMTFVTF